MRSKRNLTIEGTDQPGTELVSASMPSLFPLEEPDTYLVVGEGFPSQYLVPLQLLPSVDRKTLGEAVAGSAGIANLGVQSLEGLRHVEGLVKLAPETMNLIQGGATALPSSSGWNLGSLAIDGKITHSVRWLPAGSQEVAGVLAAVGPAAALVAIQWQLAQISRLVESNIQLTRRVRETQKSEDWARASGHAKSIAAAIRHARKVGRVTKEIWTEVQAQASNTYLLAGCEHFSGEIVRELGRLRMKMTVRQHIDWLEGEADFLLNDLNSLITCESGWFMYQALHIGYLLEIRRDDKDTADHIASIKNDALAHHDEVQATTIPLIDQLYRHFRLMELCEGKRGVQIISH